MVAKNPNTYGAKIAPYVIKTILLIFFAYVVACSPVSQNVQEEIEVINLNSHLNDANLDELYKKYVSNIKVVSLETTDESLLRSISDVFFSDTHIYVMVPNPRQIFIFDSKGNYVNKLKFGNGPGEIVNMQDADFDEEKRELVVYQRPYLKHYTPTGIFIREENIPYYFSSMKYVQDGYVLTNDSGYMGCEDYPDATVLYVDRNFNLISAHLKRVEKIAYRNVDWVNFNLKLNVAVVPSKSDTIYFLSRNGFTPQYYIDYTNDKFDETTVVDMEHYTKEMFGKYRLAVYYETPTHQYFELSKISNLHIFRDKTNGVIIAGKHNEKYQLPFDIDLRGINDDYFVSVKYYSDQNSTSESYRNLFSPEDIAKINNQKEDDNPLLIFFKLKPFEDEE
jgi:hypothetical protein